MKPLRARLQAEANSKKAAQHVIEKDYALSYILAGIAKQPELASSLIFKGGTALKKIFFGDYRLPMQQIMDFMLKATKLENLEITT